MIVRGGEKERIELKKGCSVSTGDLLFNTNNIRGHEIKSIGKWIVHKLKK